MLYIHGRWANIPGRFIYFILFFGALRATKECHPNYHPCHGPMGVSNNVGGGRGVGPQTHHIHWAVGAAHYGFESQQSSYTLPFS